MCDDNTTLGAKMGHEIALPLSGQRRRKSFYDSVGPMSMYEWAVYFDRMESRL